MQPEHIKPDNVRFNVFALGLVTSAGVERINTGDFYLYAWPDSATDETAAFYCRPDLAFTHKNYTMLNGSRTVSEIAAHISELAALHVPISVDPTLANISVNGRIDAATLQGAAGQLATAAGGYLKFERDGSYTIKPLAYGSPVRAISFDALWDKPDIRQEPILSGVTVNWVDLSILQVVSEFIPAGSDLGEIKDIKSGFTPSRAEAQRIGALALEFYGHRLRYSFKYRGDMSIEAGDVVSVETDYGFRNVLVLEHEITYDSTDFLQGAIRGVEV